MQGFGGCRANTTQKVIRQIQRQRLHTGLQKHRDAALGSGNPSPQTAPDWEKGWPAAWLAPRPRGRDQGNGLRAGSSSRDGMQG